jgi:hypothetical protein
MGSGVQGQTIGGGVAGVASTVEAEGIMVYGDRTNYSEWEFVFDVNKYKPPPNPNQSAVGTPADKLGTPASSPNQPQPLQPMQPGPFQQQGIPRR